ncbi:hypothetical protein [Nitrospira moscoviensis]|nr:hypothetical protein [Nitrospira moscoviensis]
MVALCTVGAVPCLAEEIGEAQREKKPRVELSLRSWMFTSGETKWSHDASGLDSRLGNPTSKLTYKDNDTHIVELSAKVHLSRRWFVRGDVGFSVDFDRGVLIDDDYTAVGGQRLWSRTHSDVTGHGTWYVNLDAGRRIVEYAGNRGYLDLFGGFQYWRTKYEARSVRQIECSSSGFGVACNPAGTTSNQGQLAITNTTHWITPVRVGVDTEYWLTRRLSVQGKVAVSPVSVVYNEDTHHLRQVGQVSAQDALKDPSFTMWGVGVSANAEAGLKIMFTRHVALTGGYRIWWNRTYAGGWENHPVSGSSETAPLTEFQTFRHGATVGLTAFF